MASQLTLLGQRHPGLVATLQAWSQRLHKVLRGGGGWGGVKGHAINLSHSPFPSNPGHHPQAMAFGLLQCKHRDPGIAVDLVRQMFTLEWRHYTPGLSTFTTGSWYLLSPVVHRGCTQSITKLFEGPS